MSDIAIRIAGRAGRITLTRPQALNALSASMSQALEDALDAWANDPAIALVLIDAEGDRAFCAGGDITALYHQGIRGDFAPARAYWAQEYRMNARIARYPKPVVALMHGLVMGGGVGIGGHSSHRVVGETARIAMPECGIGLIPDVGGSHLLARAPGRLGEYLGLTGHRMDPADAIYAGFADHLVPQDAWPALIDDLERSGDAAAVEAAARPAPDADLAARRDAIDAAFSAPDLAALLDGLEQTGDEETLTILRGNAPLSMACTLALIRAARAEPGIEKALAREFRCTWRCISDGDLLEGVRAAVIDKDRTPRWRHSLDGELDAKAAAMLAPLGDNDLALPPPGQSEELP
jgi:enoyl-CoA hydratase/carnithine racemase